MLRRSSPDRARRARSPFVISVALAGACALLFVARPAAAATIYVSPCGDDAWTGASDVCAAPDGPKATIQAGILAATEDGDVVEIADGVYTGDGNRNINYLGFQRPDLIIRGTNGPDAVVVDLEDGGRFMRFVADVERTTVVEGLTIINGRDDTGGAFLCRSNANPTIRNCVIRDCLAIGGGSAFDGGGAIKCETGSSPLLESCVFEGNRAVVASGGAVFLDNDSLAAVRGCTFIDNDAGAIASGGGLFITRGSSVEVSDCVFRRNTAELFGGGLADFGGPGTVVSGCLFEENTTTSVADNFAAGGAVAAATSSTFIDCVFRGNDALGLQSGGGAFAVLDGQIGAHAPPVDRCVFDANTALFGGAVLVANAGSDPVFTNCLFTANEAIAGVLPATGGAVIAIDSARPEFTNSTFVGNASEGSGGGITGVIAAEPIVRSCIMYGNTAQIGNQLALERLFETDPAADLTVQYSNIEGGLEGVYVDTGPDGADGSDVTWGPGNIDADPGFVDPEGGAFQIGPGSPCIDAGDNTAVPAGIVLDLGGDPRFHDDPGTPDTGEPGSSPAGVALVDIGAYEFQNTTPPVCPDLDGSGVIGFGDLLLVLSSWGPCAGCPEDLDENGVVDMIDLGAVVLSWGPCE